VCSSRRCVPPAIAAAPVGKTVIGCARRLRRSAAALVQLPPLLLVVVSFELFHRRLDRGPWLGLKRRVALQAEQHSRRGSCNDEMMPVCPREQRTLINIPGPLHLRRRAFQRTERDLATCGTRFLPCSATRSRARAPRIFFGCRSLQPRQAPLIGGGPLFGTIVVGTITGAGETQALTAPLVEV
jgi:hypothetical protein